MKRRIIDDSKMKKVTLKITEEVYEAFFNHARTELKSNVSAEIEKFMKKTVDSLKTDIK